MLPCTCSTGSSQQVLGRGFFGRLVLPCPGSVALGHSWAAPVPSTRAPSEGGLSGCFAEGVTSNTSDSESSSSKCASRLLSRPCAYVHVCMCVHVLALPSCLVLVVVLFRGWSFLLVAPRCCCSPLGARGEQGLGRRSEPACFPALSWLQGSAPRLGCGFPVHGGHPS